MRNELGNEHWPADIKERQETNELELIFQRLGGEERRLMHLVPAPAVNKI